MAERAAGATTEAAEDFEQLAAAVDRARRSLEAVDPTARTAGIELQSAVENVHRCALMCIVKRLRADPRGRELLFEMLDDAPVRAVLALHSIIRPPLAARAELALEEVRPYLRSHGGDVELVDVREATAVVRLKGSCNGCSMSAVTLREGVTEALVGRVEGIDSVEVLDDEPATAFIPLASIATKRPPRAGDGWVGGPAAVDVPDGGMLRFDSDGSSYILTRVGNRLSCFRNECAHQGNTLDGGIVDDGVIVCPWHGFRFDAATGECMSAPGVQLEQLPLRVEGGRVAIRPGSNPDPGGPR